MTDRDDTVSRRQFMMGGGAIAYAALAPIDVSGGGTEYLDQFNGFFGSVPEAVNRYGSGGWPGWIVQYSSDDSNAFSALKDWTGGDRRTLVKHDADSNRALVAASPADVLGEDFLGGGNVLVDLDYVESVALDVRMETPDPVGALAERDAFTAPDPFLPVDGAFDQSDVAYSGDISKATLADVRAAQGVDSVSATGSGVRLAVIDDGVDVASDSSVFGSRIVAAKNFVTDETGVSNVSSAGDHGTWVAAAAAGNPSDSTYQGVAPGVDLLVGKVLGEDGGSSHDVAAAVRWADRNDADVINMSLGSHLYSPEVVAAIDEVLGEGGNVTAVCIAAGNSRQTTRWVDSPASSATDISGAFAVGATTADPPKDAKSVYFSSVGEHDGYSDTSQGETRGGTVEVAAPGASIEALVPTSSGGTTTSVKSGTSMASPLVAGVIALGLESTSWTPSEVEQRISDTAQPVPAAAVTEVGWGMAHAGDFISGTQPNQSQAEARTDAAEKRDLANRSLSGNQSRLAPLRSVIDI